jgi:hypothetical protein
VETDVGTLLASRTLRGLRHRDRVVYFYLGKIVLVKAK